MSNTTKTVELTPRQIELVAAAMKDYVPNELDKQLAALSAEALLTMKVNGII